MADGVSISSGVGTVIATDDTGAGGHVQIMKLAISTDGSGTLIPADATNGLKVQDGPAATLLGAVTETAPATDTASSGLNGRLQRIAQRLTSLIALLPAALGAGGGLKVDGSGTALPVSVASLPSQAVTNAGTFAVQVSSGLPASSNVIGKTATTGKASATGDTEITAETAGADAVSNTSNRLSSSVWSFVFNGTTWDRLRSGDVTADTAGSTGIMGVIAYMSDGAARRRMFASSGVGDANAATNILSVAQSAFNGATWDRLRSGAQANVAAATGYMASLLVGQYNATPPTLTDTRYNHLQLDVSGALKTTVGATVYVTSTPVLSVAGSYATGDYIGTTTTPQSFASAVRTSGGKGVVQSITIIDKVTTAAVPLELWLLSATFTAPTDNAAWAITDAEALTVVGVIPITTDRWFASSNNKVYSDNSLGLVVTCAATSLFYALVARGTTPTWASGDLQVSLGILND